MKVLRQYLLNDPQLKSLLENKDSIYLLQKPKELDDKHYLVYLFKPLLGGYIKDYQLEFRVIGKDLAKLIAIQSRLINLLDDPRGENIIKDESTTIRHSKLLNGGGMLFNETTGNHELILYFLCKI